MRPTYHDSQTGNELTCCFALEEAPDCPERERFAVRDGIAIGVEGPISKHVLYQFAACTSAGSWYLAVHGPGASQSGPDKPYHGAMHFVAHSDSRFAGSHTQWFARPTYDEVKHYFIGKIAEWARDG